MAIKSIVAATASRQTFARWGGVHAAENPGRI
jgi:hypothetical protein